MWYKICTKIWNACLESTLKYVVKLWWLEDWLPGNAHQSANNVTSPPKNIPNGKQAKYVQCWHVRNYLQFYGHIVLFSVPILVKTCLNFTRFSRINHIDRISEVWEMLLNLASKIGSCCSSKSSFCDYMSHTDSNFPWVCAEAWVPPAVVHDHDNVCRVGSALLSAESFQSFCRAPIVNL